jgi:hypothetical protein
MKFEKLPERAKQQFEHYKNELQARSLYSPAEDQAIIRLVTLEEEANKLTEALAKDGACQKDRDGTTRRAPELLAMLNITKIIASCRKELFLGNFYQRQERQGDYNHQPGEPDPLLDLMHPRFSDFE